MHDYNCPVLRGRKMPTHLAGTDKHLAKLEGGDSDTDAWNPDKK
jgi:hypothetical protein